MVIGKHINKEATDHLYDLIVLRLYIDHLVHVKIVGRCYRTLKTSAGDLSVGIVLYSTRERCK